MASMYEAAVAGKSRSLPALPFQYADFAVWQRNQREPETEINFWKGWLADAPALLELPTDLPRFGGATPNARLPFSIPARIVRDLRAVSQRHGTTMFMNLLGGLQAMLCCWSEQEDILVGSPVSGRIRPETETMIGSFAYPLVFRTDFSGDPTLRDVLSRVRETTLEAYRHQNVPFGRVVAAAGPKRRTSHTPVFQVMLTYPPPFEPIHSAGVTITPIEELHGARVDYDLFIALVDTDDSLSGMLTYNSDLFQETTARRIVIWFEAVLEALAGSPDLKLSALRLPDIEKYRSRHVFISNDRIDLHELESAITEDPFVESVHVLPRRNEAGQIKLVAYVAATGALEAARGRFQQRFTGRQPDAWVAVTPMPLTSCGRVDEEALLQLPVIDDSACLRLEETLNQTNTLKQAAAVVADYHHNVRPLHLDDVLPDWKPESSSDDRPDRAPESADAPVVQKQRPPAFSDGGPLLIPVQSPRTLTAALLQSAERSPQSGLTCIDSFGVPASLTFATLLAGALRVLEGLRDHGLKPRDTVVLQIENLSDHFIAFWGCVLGGITPVTVAIAPSYAERNAVISKLANIWELLERPPIITSSALAPAIGVLEALVPMPGLRLLPVEELQSYPPAQRIHDSRPDDLVFFQLTSGSTGVPKCIQETHRGIIAHIHGSQQFNGYSAEDVTLNWLPLDHVVPILTVHLKDVYLGCKEIQVKSNWILTDVLRWLDLIETYRVTHTWAPNFAYKMVADRLAREADRTWDLSSIRYFMNAGEQVTLNVISDFLNALVASGLPQRAMQPAFGMAEVCTCMTYQNDFSAGTGAHWIHKGSLGGPLANADRGDKHAITFVDLGPPVPGIQIRITDSANQVVPEGTIGRFQIRGDSVTPGYLRNEAANREAFVGDGWFNSGDLGFILDGRLTLTGREKEMIVVRGANFYCYEIEDVINGVDGVEPTFSAACAVEDSASGSEGLALFFVPRIANAAIEELALVVREIRSRVTANLGINPAVVIPLSREEFPKTTSGKIQRSQLKKQLAGGLFAERIKQFDIALENSRTVPDWFYVPRWVRKNTPSAASICRTGTWFIVSDDPQLAEQLSNELGIQGINSVPVLDREAVDDRPDHKKLLASLAANGTPPDTVIHLSTKSSGLFSLLHLSQALAQFQPAHRLIVLSTGSQSITKDDASVSERAMLPAMVRTIAAEFPWLHCTHIDMRESDLTAITAHLLRERDSIQKELEVAIRQERRFVPRLAKVDWSNVKRERVPIRSGGMYIVSGGAGGIGSAVCVMLLQRFGCRLLILGRASREAKSKELRQFAAVGGHVRYESVDVADCAAVRTAVDRARAEWNCEPDGVFHLAGTLVERPLVEETAESFAESVRAKTIGARVLHEVIADRPETLFVAFSSVNGFFGGLNAAAYSAASRYLEAFAHHRRALGFSKSYCLSWSLWDDIGMSRGYAGREPAAARGYRSIGVQAGIVSMLAALRLETPDVLIGIDATRPFVRLHTESRGLPTSSLVVYAVPRDPAEKEVAVEMRDEFGQRLSSDLQYIDRLPISADGSIDRSALRSVRSNGKAREERIAPRNELERNIAALWKELLGLPELGVHDNFFDLGGHSLLLYQLHNRLRELTRRDVDMIDLIGNPTVAALADRLNRAAETGIALERGRDRAAARQNGRQRLDQLRQMRAGRGNND
jgi:acyl-CoA synthetase (AMP-forming)/AMP-acid ligase II